MSGMHYRWFDAGERTDEFGLPKNRGDIDREEHEREEELDKEHLYSRGEKVSLVLAGVLLLDALVEWDTTMFILSAAFLLFEMRKLAAAFGGEHGEALANGLKGFSIVLFFGTLVATFF